LPPSHTRAPLPLAYPPFSLFPSSWADAATDGRKDHLKTKIIKTTHKHKQLHKTGTTSTTQPPQHPPTKTKEKKQTQTKNPPKPASPKPTKPPPHPPPPPPPPPQKTPKHPPHKTTPPTLDLRLTTFSVEWFPTSSFLLAICLFFYLETTIRLVLYLYPFFRLLLPSPFFF